MNATKKKVPDQKGVSWWKPVALAAVFSAVGWMANTFYTDFVVKPAEQKAQRQAATLAAVNDVKAELSQPLQAALGFLKRVNTKGDPPDAVGHLVVSSLRTFLKIVDTDEDTKKLDMLPSTLHDEVLRLAKALKSSELIMSNRPLSSYSTPDSVAILNKFEPEMHSVWVHLARLK